MVVEIEIIEEGCGRCEIGGEIGVVVGWFGLVVWFVFYFFIVYMDWSKIFWGVVNWLLNMSLFFEI